MQVRLSGPAKPKSSLFVARGGASRPPCRSYQWAHSFIRTEFLAGRERHMRVRAKFSDQIGDKFQATGRPKVIQLPTTSTFR